MIIIYHKQRRKKEMNIKQISALGILIMIVVIMSIGAEWLPKRGKKSPEIGNLLPQLCEFAIFLRLKEKERL